VRKDILEAGNISLGVKSSEGRSDIQVGSIPKFRRAIKDVRSKSATPELGQFQTLRVTPAEAPDASWSPGPVVSIQMLAVLDIHLLVHPCLAEDDL
jgi:hypothetical protein